MQSSNEPKYQQLKNFIVDYIQQGELKQGDRIFSEMELTERFEISRHTVRKALGDLVNEGWLYTEQGSGTFVSDPIKINKDKSKLIGVVTTYIKDYIFPEIISGIEKVLSDAGYSIILCNTGNKIEKERQVLMNLLNSQLDGIILEPTKSVFPNHNKDLFDKLFERRVPVVNIHSVYSNIPASYVVEDDRKAGAIASEHLLELGHKKIAGIYKNDDAQGYGRYEGFVNSLRRHGLPIYEDAILWYNTEDKKALFSKENIRKMMKRIEGCTGIICYNDEVAIDFLNILKKVDRSALDRLSVVSFDNSGMARNSEYKLTSVAHPKAMLGERAAQALLDIINDPHKIIHEVMEPVLVLGESTRACK